MDKLLESALKFPHHVFCLNHVFPLWEKKITLELDSKLFTVSPGSDDELLILHRVKRNFVRGGLWHIARFLNSEKPPSLNPGIPWWQREKKREKQCSWKISFQRKVCCPICKIKILFLTKHSYQFSRDLHCSWPCYPDIYSFLRPWANSTYHDVISRSLKNC